MQKKLILFGSAFFIFLLFGCFLFFSIEEKPINEFVQTNPSVSQNKEENTKLNDPSNSEMTSAKTDSSKSLKSENDNKSQFTENMKMNNDDLSEELADTEPMEYPDTIEGIKAQIYSKNIEYVEQVELLDDLVQTGDADVKEFWNDDWSSADDWKKKTNGFKLEKNDNGDLVFSPDEQTARTYTFLKIPRHIRMTKKTKSSSMKSIFTGKRSTMLQSLSMMMCWS